MRLVSAMALLSIISRTNALRPVSTQHLRQNSSNWYYSHFAAKKIESQDNVLRQLSLFKVEDSTKKEKILCFWVSDDETSLSSLDLLKDSRQIYKCRVIFQAQFPGPGSPRVSRPLLIFLVPFLPEQFHVLKRSAMHRISLEWGSTFQTDWIPSQITDTIFA